VYLREATKKRKKEKEEEEKTSIYRTSPSVGRILSQRYADSDKKKNEKTTYINEQHVCACVCVCVCMLRKQHKP
jgi:hypothetical protein